MKHLHTWKPAESDPFSVEAEGHAYDHLSVTYAPTADEEMLAFDLPWHAELWEEDGVVSNAASFKSADAALLWAEAEDLRSFSYDLSGASMTAEHEQQQLTEEELRQLPKEENL